MKTKIQPGKWRCALDVYGFEHHILFLNKTKVMKSECQGTSDHSVYNTDNKGKM